jgi:hypothetical protein
MPISPISALDAVVFTPEQKTGVVLGLRGTPAAKRPAMRSMIAELALADGNPRLSPSEMRMLGVLLSDHANQPTITPETLNTMAQLLAATRHAKYTVPQLVFAASQPGEAGKALPAIIDLADLLAAMQIGNIAPQDRQHVALQLNLVRRAFAGAGGISVPMALDPIPGGAPQALRYLYDPAKAAAALDAVLNREASRFNGKPLPKIDVIPPTPAKLAAPADMFVEVWSGTTRRLYSGPVTGDAPAAINVRVI